MSKKLIQLAKEDMAFYGVEFTSLQKLLAIVGGINDPALTGELAAIGVRRLSKMTEEDLVQLGVKKSGAARIIASWGLNYHLNESKKEERWIIRSPEDAAQCFENILLRDQEEFVCAYLNTKNEVIKRKSVFKGSLNASIVHPREIMNEAVRVSAASFICAHNHPSGDPSPSREDIEVTKRLVKVGDLMGIKMLDHIIVGDKRFVSMKEKGYI